MTAELEWFVLMVCICRVEELNRGSMISGIFMEQGKCV